MTDQTDASAAELLEQSVAPDPTQAAPPSAPEQGSGQAGAAEGALAAYEAVDWQGLHGRDPQAAVALWAAYQGLRFLVDGPGPEPAAGRSEDRAGPEVASTPDTEAIAVAEPRAEPAEPTVERIDPPTPTSLPPEVTAFGLGRGFSAEEMSGATDPRVRGVLQLAMVGEQALIQHAKAKAFAGHRPPTQVGGRGHPGHLSDHSSTEAWMQARHTQLRKKARR